MEGCCEEVRDASEFWWEGVICSFDGNGNVLAAGQRLGGMREPCVLDKRNRAGSGKGLGLCLGLGLRDRMVYE